MPIALLWDCRNRSFSSFLCLFQKGEIPTTHNSKTISIVGFETMSHLLSCTLRKNKKGRLFRDTPRVGPFVVTFYNSEIFRFFTWGDLLVNDTMVL